MSVPEPLFPLEEHCSVIHNNILYVYSPDGLQSLPLEIDAEWSREPMGVSVTGASCVLGNIGGVQSSTALYIVGGATNASSLHYPGLQRYSFLDKRWVTITPQTPVTQNRQRHSAAFLSASSSILVYAGSQDGDNVPSTQTFVIDSWPPYIVRSFTSIAPSVIDPSLLPWSDSRVAMIGGSPTNDQIFTFAPDDGWTNVGVRLSQLPPSRSIARSAVLSLDDASKVLVTFDFSQSPNQVSRTVILDPGGQLAPYGKTVGDGSGSSRLRARDLWLSTFPSYNESSAPTALRTGASMAQDSKGLTVITGGNDQDPLSIFDVLQNRWVSAVEFLGDESQIPADGSPTSSTPMSSASSTSTSTSSSDALSTPPLTILAIVLGSVCGIAALLITALLLLRFLKRRNFQRQQQNNSAIDFSHDKKRKHGRPSSEDQVLRPIKPAAQPMGHSIPPSARGIPSTGEQVNGDLENSPTKSHLNLDFNRLSNPSLSTSMFSRTKDPRATSRPHTNAEPAEFLKRQGTSGVRSPAGDAVMQSRSTYRTMDSSWSTYFCGNAGVDVGEELKTSDSTTSGARPGSHGGHRHNSRDPVANQRNTRPGLTDSHGNQLEKFNVPKRSPTIGHAVEKAPGLEVTMRESIPVQISRIDSTATSLADEFNTGPTLNKTRDVSDVHQTTHPLDDVGQAFSGHSWSGPPHRLIRPPSSSYTNSIQPQNFTMASDEAWLKSSIRPITQWPRDSPVISPHLVSGSSSTVGWNNSADEAQPVEGTRDFFGANNHHPTHQRDVSWLNLHGNGHTNVNEAQSGDVVRRMPRLFLQDVRLQPEDFYRWGRPILPKKRP